jgi:ParB family chromosome partitioning protein
MTMSNLKNKKRGLGRGLDAILESPDTDITSTDISGNYVAGAIAEIAIDKIEANPFQPRTDFEDMPLRELAASIKQQGVIQPVTVRKMGYDRYQLISGERRLRASKMAGLETIPVFVRVANDEQMLEMALIENIHRENLNAIEDECNLTQEKLSEQVGKSRTSITNFVRLLKLPPEIQVALRDGHITMGHARAIINIEDPTKQLHILQQIIDKELNVRQVEALVRALNNPKDSHKDKLKVSLPEIFKIQSKEISEVLECKTEVKREVTGKGSLMIHFKSDEDFNRLYTILSQK